MAGPGFKNNYDFTYVRGRKYDTTYKSYLLDNSKKTLPNVSVSPVTHLIQGFNFIVRLNNFTFGFKDVSGLSVSNRVDYLEEGGVNDHQIMVGRPNDETPTLQFRRGLMVRANPILSVAARAAAARIQNNLARKAALMAVNSQDPQATLESGPAVGIIEVYDRNKRLSAMYTFLSLGMTEWSVDDLNADDGSILVESITIAHTGLVRVPLGAPNTFLGYLGLGAKDDSQVQKNAESALEKWKDFDNKRKALLDEQSELLKNKQSELDELKQELKEKEDARQAAIDAQKEAMKKAESEREDADKKAKDDADKMKEEIKEKAEKVEEAKQKAAEENEEKDKEAKEKAKAAKDKAIEDRKAQIDARQAELDEQKAAIDEASKDRTEYDKQFEDAEANRKDALEAQKEALKEADSKRKESDEKAKSDAEKARDKAKENAEKVEEKKKGGS